MSAQRHVVILVFDDAEVLDVCGPFEVFSVAGHRRGSEPFRVSLASEHPAPILLRNGFSVNPHYRLADCPPADILIIPGGPGARREVENPVVQDWIREQASSAELVLSVCTGALLLGVAGLLDGLDATTHAGAMSRLGEVAPRARIRPGVRFTDNGRILTSAGVSAGIDLSLHVVETLLGEGVAEETAGYMEYHWDRNEEGIADLGL
jgi:transcriptional regulator GlxA family with amidase domain